MTLDPAPLDRVMRARVVRFNARLGGIAAGLVSGLALFLATNWLVLKGGRVVGPHLSLLGQFLIGYQVTFAGSLVGLGYGFVVGYVVGYSVARIYNWVAARRDRAAPLGEAQ